MRVAPTIKLTKKQRNTLTRLVNGRRTEVRVVMRAQIVLAAARGLENREIAEELGVTRETVGRWRSRFAEKSVEGITQGPATRRTQAHESVEGRRPHHPDDDAEGASERDSLEHAHARGGA